MASLVPSIVPHMKCVFSVSVRYVTQVAYASLNIDTIFTWVCDIKVVIRSPNLHDRPYTSLAPKLQMLELPLHCSNVLQLTR